MRSLSESAAGTTKRTGILLTVCGGILALAAVPSQAADLVITSLTDNGVMTWTYPSNGVSEYRIEWASDLLLGDWTDTEHGFRGISPTGGVMSAHVPMFYRVKAMGTQPVDMVYIPAGRFDMGDTYSEGSTNERPVHSVYVSAFYMDRYEVSKAKWDEVATWAATNGYDISAAGGSGKAADHPVWDVTWYEAVKWCNARSEKEKLTPAYYTSTQLIPAYVYKTGTQNLANDWVRWDAGYRLPTEAEREKAARGGHVRHRFAWPDADTISHERANYNAGIGGYDLSTGGYHPAYTNDPTPYTCPVGSFAPNGYGLYGVCGNLGEWCWDWYSETYYQWSETMDPVGPGSGTERVTRDSSWDHDASLCRVGRRGNSVPTRDSDNLGFRTVLPSRP